YSIGGIIGGIAFFFGTLIVTPLLSKENINFLNPELWIGAVLTVVGLTAVTAMAFHFIMKADETGGNRQE
ncbi:MAG: hypothetical protein ABEJ72_09945, partial [Candidatus Aenigmatarchaeota archaeon]